MQNLNGEKFNVLTNNVNILSRNKFKLIYLNLYFYLVSSLYDSK